MNREEAVQFLKSLRDNIVSSFEKIEGGQRFERKNWSYEKGYGGGEMSVLRGKVFEKAAVNWSGVGGDKFPMDDSSGAFFATGVSLITHMANPKVPTVHMNVRYIETEEKSWLGGGYDLTPMGFPVDEDTRHFHEVAKNCLNKFSPDLYPKFSQWAKEYFYIPHRKRERGVGGIFFDHYSSANRDQDIEMWQSVGKSFLPAYIPIVERHLTESFTETDRLKQLEYRAHYAEFNLLYDRGTRFGFQSGGNHEAILCSMPPMCSW
ncbi:MAG: oxygen-dependent coproporphyrinogen oxidase [Bdellovibrionota bacterium]